MTTGARAKRADGQASDIRPEFADNQALTMAAAIKAHLEWLGRTQQSAPDLSIASGYFDPAGFALLATQLEHLPKVRLLLGAEPVTPPSKPRPRPGRSAEEYNRDAVDEALQAHQRGLESDRDLLGFTPEIDTTIERLLKYLRSGKIEVRRYEAGFLHGKAFLFRHGTGDPEGYLVGSSNFTGAGLASNVELNVGRYDTGPVQHVCDWFDRLWEQSRPFDLESYYEARFQDYTPWVVYLRVLLERFGSDLEGDQLDGEVRLTSFQRDGASRARRILDRYNGVLFADGVGLGKTFIGGDLIREARLVQRQRALLICPASLRDGTWARFQALHDFRFETVSFEELTMWFRDPINHSLDAPPEDYSLVVVDEAHAFRNPETERARALRHLLRGSPPKKLILMSATPVNNSLWDLYYLITYFAQHDAVFADRGVPSLKGRFEEAMREDPDQLRPDALFDILDATTVRRTRNFVKKAYPHERILLRDGTTVEITFPRPRVMPKTYDFNKVLPGFFRDFADTLQPPEGPPRLRMARYAPSNFLANEALGLKAGAVRSQRVREAALAGLLRSGLLKRLESSAYAFRKTLERMVTDHGHFLDALDHGIVPSSAALEELREVDTDEAFDELLDKTSTKDFLSRTDSSSARFYDIPKLRAAVSLDGETLSHFLELSRKVKPDSDPKLAELEEILVEILRRAESDGRTDVEKADNRKVIIFSYFADTVEWIKGYLEQALETNRALSAYRGRLAVVSGDEGSRLSAVFGFAPRSSEAPKGRDSDRFDILLTTDILAEGQNLQQARNIINFDLPWNPMRLVQRHGRIDRIGSPHRSVFIWCFFPDEQLDSMLLLEERIRGKIAQAAASIGVEGEVIPDSVGGEVVFADERSQILRIRSGDSALLESAGEDPHAHSGEEYRRDLQVALQNAATRTLVSSLPFGVGSGLRGIESGFFFCIRIGDGNDARTFLRFKPDGKPVIRDTLQCLRRITCRPDTPRDLPSQRKVGVFDAWSEVQQDVYGEWTRATDPKTLTPEIPRILRSIGEHLHTNRPADLTLHELDRFRESVEAPWGFRIQKLLREVFEDEGLTPVEKSRQVIARIKELGLQPYKAPEPLPPIRPEDVRLVCWMAVST